MASADIGLSIIRSQANQAVHGNMMMDAIAKAKGSQDALAEVCRGMSSHFSKYLQAEEKADEQTEEHTEDGGGGA